MSLKEAAQLVALGAVSSISSFTHYLAIDMLSVSAAIAIQLQLIQPSGLWRWRLSSRRQSEMARRSRRSPSLHSRHLRHVPLVVLEVDVVAIVDGQAVENGFAISYTGLDLLVAHADLAQEEPRCKMRTSS